MMKFVDPILEELRIDNVSAVVTDNAPNMNLLKTKISEKYESIFSIGCAAHGLNLLIQDIASIENIMNILNKDKNIVVEIRNSLKK